MKQGEMIRLPWAVRKILYDMTDEKHRITMPELIAALEDEGIKADRRSVYKAIRVLNSYGEQVVYKRTENIQGYYIRRYWSLAEILFLRESVSTSNALSPAVSKQLAGKLESPLSSWQRSALPESVPASNKTDNDKVLAAIELLLDAISENKAAEFLYYDLTVTRKRAYRRHKEKYRLFPRSVICRAGRWYCIFYSEKHGSFSNYRIDKMEDVKLTDIMPDQPVPFDLQTHLRDSFQMYHGEADTVTIRFDRDLAGIVYDEFGTGMIISAVSETSFTANIRTAVTPTLVSWLMQFAGRCEVLRPNALIRRMTEVSTLILEQYEEKEK